MSWLRRIAATGALAPLLACQSAPEAAQGPAPDPRFSYALGARLGQDLRKSSHALDREQLLRGVGDGLAGSSALSDDEIAAALREGVEQSQQQQAVLRSEAALAAERDGREFLARNRARPGVVELPSGLQLEVLHEGAGPVPGPEDFVTCHYRGTLLDGSAFDDTATRGTPRTFQVTSVIDGFEEALLRMPAGSHWKLYVPAALGYGDRGAGHAIPPHAVLLFDVELIEVRRAPAN